jgi:uncharacterized protein YbaR (Trm112 family)
MSDMNGRGKLRYVTREYECHTKVDLTDLIACPSCDERLPLDSNTAVEKNRTGHRHLSARSTVDLRGLLVLLANEEHSRLAFNVVLRR